MHFFRTLFLPLPASIFIPTIVTFTITTRQVSQVFLHHNGAPIEESRWLTYSDSENTGITFEHGTRAVVIIISYLKSTCSFFNITHPCKHSMVRFGLCKVKIKHNLNSLQKYSIIQIVRMDSGDTLELRSDSLSFGFYYISLCIELALTINDP